MVKICSKMDNSLKSTAKIFLSLVLICFLIIPAFADSYIIEPQDIIGPMEKLSVSMARNSVKTTCNPIYGTDACSGEFTKEQVKELKKNFNVYENPIVHTTLNESVPQIEADDVWDVVVNGINLTGKGQTVCIIDTGIDYNHYALGGAWGNKVIAGYRFLDNGTDEQECNATNHTACWDDHYHGTHCAGIVSSTHSIYRGVAPDAKLVIVKALDYTGHGWGSDITSGINYCVNNAEEYNISVISMSLGTNINYNTYCDNYIPLLTTAINNAVAKNISVIIASGNDGYLNAISWPSCIYNATPVSSVYGDDTIANSRNYWSLPLLFAPGESIVSTYPLDLWASISGTSMSTPHVAGVFALMNQYLELSGKTKTPQELEDISIETGLTISGTDNSRVDAYDFYLNLSDNKYDISSCTIIDESGEYKLTADIINSNATTCIDITADNVTLDCGGYIINGNGTGTSRGIRIMRGSSTNTNITIKNCIVNEWGYGIYLENSNKNTIENNSVSDNSYGIRLRASGDNVVINNTARDNDFYGLYLVNLVGGENTDGNNVTGNEFYNNSFGIAMSAADNNTIEYNEVYSNRNHGIHIASNENIPKNSTDNIVQNNNVFLNNGNGIYLLSAVRNQILNNNISSNNEGIVLETSDFNLIYNNFLDNNSVYDNGTNSWNTTKQTGPNIIGGLYIGGNYYSDYSGTDTNGDGFGEVPYNIPGGINTDYLPLVRDTATPINSCMIINTPGDYILTADIINSTAEKCIKITADNVSLYCQGHMIDGNDSGSTDYGVYSTNDNTLIYNCTITDWKQGIKYLHANSGYILNNKIYSNIKNGIIMDESTHNHIAYNEIHDNEIGLRFEDSSNNSVINDNIITSNDKGVSITTSCANPNLFYNNYFNNTQNADDDGNTFWNTGSILPGPNIVGGKNISGNYYLDYSGTDVDDDGFGDTHYVIAGSGGNQDNFPLVIPDLLKITTDFFNITFDREHGGVVTSLQYKGVDFITGGDNGRWGTIGLRKSTWNGSGDVCILWGANMSYQYDQNHILTVNETVANYTVTISSNGASEVLGTDREIVWEIPKHLNVLKLKYQSGYGNEYLYMPFIRDYNSKTGDLIYHTTSGNITAEDLPYCQSRWYTASMVEYKLHSGLDVINISISPTELSTTSAYYGNDTKTWQLHYPFEGVDQKDISMTFY